MRVIAGIYRGRVLVSPTSDFVRPTPDKVKEAVFSILAPKIADADWLELFGGAGGMAIEAMSRGAKSATLCDSSRESYRLIQLNFSRVGADAEVLYADYRAGAKKLIGRQFDIIYLDPPYATDYAEKALKLIGEYGLLKEDGQVVVESETPFATPKGFALSDERKYGRVRLTFYKREVTT